MCEVVVGARKDCLAVRALEIGADKRMKEETYLLSYSEKANRTGAQSLQIYPRTTESRGMSSVMRGSMGRTPGSRSGKKTGGGASAVL